MLAWHRRMGADKAVFNFANLTLAVWTSGSLFFAASDVAPLLHGGQAAGRLILPLALLSVSYFAINTGMIAAAIGLEARTSPFLIWRRHFLRLSPGYAASASLALLLVVALQQVYFAAFWLLPPVLLVFYYTLRSSFGRVEDAKGHLDKLNTLYLSTVEALATAIDAKDEVTHGHIRRVQLAATGLARELGVKDEETLKAIEAAALRHDTGKIAIPEHRLRRPRRSAGPARGRQRHPARPHDSQIASRAHHLLRAKGWVLRARAACCLRRARATCCVPRAASDVLRAAATWLRATWAARARRPWHEHVARQHVTSTQHPAPST